MYYGIVASYTNTPVPYWAYVPVIGPFLEDLPFVNIMVEGLDLAHIMNMFSLVGTWDLGSS